MYDPEEKLIWEHYLKEADFSHGSFKGDPDVEPMARMTAHDFEEERPDDLSDGADLLDMSDAELVHAAHETGVEDIITFDGEGGVVNREEVIDAVRGDSNGDDELDLDDDDVKWEESTHNPDQNPDQMDTASVRTVQPVNEYGAAIVQGAKALANNPTVRKLAGDAAKAGAERIGTNVADRLTKKPEEEVEEETNEEVKNVEGVHNPDLNPDQLDTAGVRIVKQDRPKEEGCGSNPVAGKLVKIKGKKKGKAKMPGSAMDKIKKLMGF